MRYSCSVCGSPISLANGETKRSCSHAVGIIAHCSATCYGEGGASSNGNALSRVIRKIIAIIKRGKT